MNFHIPTIAPDILFYIKSVPVTNTVINVWIAIFIFLIIGILIKRSVSLAPGKLQNTLEYFLEKLLDLFDKVTADRKKTLRFLPIVGTIFFFILISNWLGLLPGTGSITYGNQMLLRPANTDLNLVLVMSLIVLASSHVFGFITIGFFKHTGKFIQIKPFLLSFTKGPIAVFVALMELAVGLIEIVSEFAKVLSLSFRLFGNMFAGEVLITIMTGLVAFLIPTPFMILEVLVGLIQAGVFAILALVYFTIATSLPHGEH